MSNIFSTVIYESDHLAMEFENQTFYKLNLMKASVRLLFVVKSLEEDSDANYPISIISVRVPTKYPNYNIRTLIRAIEKKLLLTYNEANLIGALIKWKGSSKWEFNSRVIDAIQTIAFDND